MSRWHVDSSSRVLYVEDLVIHTHTHIAILYAIAAGNCVLCKDAAALMNGIIVCLSVCLSVCQCRRKKKNFFEIE
jgi:hypothetical protein